MSRPLLDRVAAVPPIGEQIARFVRQRLPRFKAPTDPAAWTRRAARLRREALAKIYLRGWPKELIARKPPVVFGEVLRPDPSHVIRKLRYEIYPNYWIPALLYEPAKLTGRVPVVLNPNGHHAGGKAVDYKQARCINLARRGMIALNFEFIGMGELGGDSIHNDLLALDVTGMVSVGFFYLAMSKGLDVLLARRHADPARVAMTGLSGGGWQTIVLSALDTRITLSVPVAGYTSLAVRSRRITDLGDGEQTPADLATVLAGDYQDLTAMLAPRPTLQILNEADTCCFRPDLTKPAIYDALRPTWRAYGAEDRFAFHRNLVPGTHNYEADNRGQLYRFLAKHFDLPKVEGDLHDDREMFAEHELNVSLPPEQTLIRSVARRRAHELAASLGRPRTAAQRLALRRKLAAVIRLPRYKARARTLHKSKTIESQYLKVGPWTLPLAIARRRRQGPVELVLSDSPAAGRAYAERTESGTVVRTDILATGRFVCSPQYLLLLQARGERALGVQVAQILAAAAHAAAKGRTDRVRLTALGLSTGFASLLAAALEPGRFESLTVTDVPASLCYLFDRPVGHEHCMPLLCPDLLTVADIPQLIDLLEGVAYTAADRRVPPTARSGR